MYSLPMISLLYLTLYYVLRVSSISEKAIVVLGNELGVNGFTGHHLSHTGIVATHRDRYRYGDISNNDIK